jgi:hypothetical protein
LVALIAEKQSRKIMLSYHNDPAVKQKYIERFARHRAADEVIQGRGYFDGRGCFVGCTLEDYDHKRFPIELGWPEWLAHLADAIFEGLPKTEAAQFGTDLLEAVPVGVDLNPTQWKIAIFRYERQLKTLESNTENYAAACRAAIIDVIVYCKAQLEGYADEEVRIMEDLAAWSARSAAEMAAWSARMSAAESAVWSAWRQEKNDLLEILRHAK